MKLDGTARAPWPRWLSAIAVVEVGLLIGTTVAFGFLEGFAIFLVALLPLVLVMLPIGIIQGYRRSRHGD